MEPNTNNTNNTNIARVHPSVEKNLYKEEKKKRGEGELLPLTRGKKEREYISLLCYVTKIILHYIALFSCSSSLTSSLFWQEVVILPPAGLECCQMDFPFQPSSSEQPSFSSEAASKGHLGGLSWKILA